MRQGTRDKGDETRDKRQFTTNISCAFPDYDVIIGFLT